MRPRFASEQEKLLVHLSNFRPVKRILDVVEIFARVANALPARLMMIGDGPDRSAAEHLALTLGVQDRIHFLGKQDNVNELLPLADLMLMPSEMESFGLAALEAMACSVPSIATRVGGVPELIDDGAGPQGGPANGLLFPVGDIEAMANAAIAAARRRRPPARHGHRRPQNRQRPLLLQPDHSALRGVLRTRPRPQRGTPAACPALEKWLSAQQ
jgi:N-acetyl-alpha-D-glucosaminyl L-malate synthase BshA